MHVHLVAPDPPTLLIAGALSSAGCRVTSSSPIERLRLRLPGGWHVVTIGESAAAGAGDVLLRGEGAPSESGGPTAAGRGVVVRSGYGGSWPASPEEATECAALFDVVRDADTLEVVDDLVRLVVPVGSGLRALAPLAGRVGIRIDEARSAGGAVSSLLLLRLLDLPVALCGTTFEHFLSRSEGRRIAAAVLDEGFRVAERVGPSPAPIAWRDPRELARRLAKHEAGFDAWRSAPGRRFPAALAALWAGEDAVRLVPQRLFVKAAADAGVPADWNRRLLGMLPRVARSGCFRAPAELLRAVA